MIETWLFKILSVWHEGVAGVLAPLLTVVKILLIGAIVYFLLIRFVVRLIAALADRTRVKWDQTLVRHGVVHRLAALVPGLLLYILPGLWLAPGSVLAQVIQVFAQLWIMIAGLLTFYALLNAFVEFYENLPFARQMPVRGFVQSVKLLLFLVVLVIAIAALMGKSPTLLVSGLGAMTAVLMLIFKDPILGFVAGIQLSANRMLAVGDWLEMPKYQADGAVIEITLTTIKVRNWDQTITTVPTYALIADSFKNWRGMQEVGGRRIARSLFIDMHSVHFLTSEDIERLRKAQLISHYIEDKLKEIERHNREHHIDPESPVNGRRLTNLGTFRAYLLAYLKSHPGIHQDLIVMVRQLQPTHGGLPIQIYAFTRDTAWIAYEGVQADIFDHLLSVIQEFGLRVFQTPSGADVRDLTSLTTKIS